MERTWGVSVFLGSGEPATKMDTYLSLASRLGARHVFTSCHVPEVPLDRVLAELGEMAAAARRLGLEVTADIAPGALAGMGAKPENLAPAAAMGLAAIRLDYGFGPHEVAALTRNPEGLRIVLNTSTVTPAYIAAALAAGARPERLESCHNYYPRPETGISVAALIASSRAFTAQGLRVSAFVPGSGVRRGPVFAGLPTVERHRNLPAARGAVELWATGAVDSVLFGDPYASIEELEAVALVAERQPATPLRIHIRPDLSETERVVAVGSSHCNREDPAEFVIRSTTSRAYAARGPGIEPRAALARPRGTVTIDNRDYLRYSGELQIALVDLPADPRVNVVGQVVAEDLSLLDLIGAGQPFALLPA
ncbi:MAG: DUF871 domain-containing protein [Symbiobacteriia bacterium]